jgi:GTP-binding protein
MSETAEILFRIPCQFVAGAASIASLPEFGPPEIAFAGRSNVGKSSLLNALVNRRDLARVSAQPGRTKQINFYDLGGKMRLVDMPGHGYARVSRTISAEWSKLTEHYVRFRPTLLRVMLLIDPKAGFKESDRDLMSLLDKAALSYQIVLTKIDRLGEQELAAIEEQVKAVIKKHPAAHPVILKTSAEKSLGIDALQESLFYLVMGKKEHDE